jgi:hypothetical protein
MEAGVAADEICMPAVLETSSYLGTAAAARLECKSAKISRQLDRMEYSHGYMNTHFEIIRNLLFL